VLATAALGLAVGLPAARAQEQETEIAETSAPDSTAVDLYLEVFINDAPTNLIGNIKQLPDGGLAADAAELEELGLKPLASAQTEDGLVRLDQLSNVSYRLDEGAQRLYVTAIDDARAAKVVDVGAQDKQDRLKPRTSPGAVLNYTLYASSNELFDDDIEPFQGISGGFDARIFGPLGVVSQSFITGYRDDDFENLVRLDTTWSYSDPERLITYRTGDFISGGLAWTRPVHLGGIQISRNFSLRSDLVTLPLPSFSGTAAVPSTLEVYTQNARTYAGTVGSGPFQLVNLPAFTGGGQARVVLKDSLGRETVVELPYYVSSMMLGKGFLDFSVDAGYARRNFGIESDDYDQRLMGVATVRYGLTDWLTVEGHMEGGVDLLNGGGGVAFPLGRYGAASLALAGSYADGASGGLVNASVEMNYQGWTLYGRVQQALGDYQDIASITADQPVVGPDSFPIYSAGVPRTLAQVTVGVPTPLDFSNLNLSYTHFTDAEGERSRIVGMSYSQTVFERSTLYATAFKDLDDGDSFGVYAGISVPFGDDITASAATEYGPDGVNAVLDLAKTERREIGSVGWRLRTSEGDTPLRSAAASYRSRFGRVEGGVQQYGGDFRATGQFDGAIAVAGGGVFATNRIDDAFAVVDVGAPDVEVSVQNRRVGKTDSRGRILVPDLNAYEPNAISIDPTRLPVDAEIASTKDVVMPADRGGVVVDFGVSATSAAALVSFIDVSGAPIRAGLQGRLDGNSEPFVVGYDGEAYLQGLGATNSVSIDLEDGTSCGARFSYRPTPGEQVAIRGIVCQ
jgi:outer membrane usher protein